MCINTNDMKPGVRGGFINKIRSFSLGEERENNHVKNNIYYYSIVNNQYILKQKFISFKS